MSVKARELAVLAVILALYAVSLGRTCSYDYVWDDVGEIERSTAFDRPLSEGLLLTQTQRAAADLASLVSVPAFYGLDSYRPLLFASYWCDVRLWGRDAGALHRTNVVLGGLAILLAYLLARRLLRSPWALAVVALFALHPVQVETVAYISARGDLLAGLFVLAAAYAAVRAIDTSARGRAVAWTALAVLAFAASLFSKEAGLALPLGIAALVAAREPTTPRRRWWIAAVLAAVAIGYLPLRAALVTTAASGAPGGALVSVPGGLLEYARIVLVPFDLSIERMPHASFIALGWLAVLAGAGLLGWVTWRARGVGLATAGLVWACALLAPSMIALHAQSVVADRYAYAALFGIALAAVTGARELVRVRPALARIVAGVALVWALALAAVQWQQVPVWTDADTLYRHAVEMAPESSRAHYRVAVLDVTADRWDLAVPELQRAIELDPANVEALNNLGVYQLPTDPAAAAVTLDRAIAANPEHYRAWLNLGLAQLALGQHGPGCASIAHALAINPRYAAALAAQRRSCPP